MLKRMPFHSLLFCIFPIMYLYSVGISEVKFSDTLFPLFINLGLGFVSYLIIYAITKDHFQTGFETSIILLIYSTFGHITSFLLENGYFLDDQGPIIAFFLAAFILLTWINFRIIKDHKPITEFLNVVSIVLVLISTFNITNSWLRTQTKFSTIPIIESQKPLETPDIYYIILDSYAGNEMLPQVFNYDNQPFIDSLEGKGFFVANGSKSNYVRTNQSLGSTLNLNYYSNENWMSELLRNDSSLFYDLINNNLVNNQLAYFDYKTYTIPNSLRTIYWENSQFVGNIPIGTPFLWNYLRTTILTLFWNSLPFKVYQTQSLNSLNHLEDAVEIEGPKFVFFHILMPHPPFVFDKNGNSNYSSGNFTLLDANELGLPVDIYHEKYVEQLQFINSKIDQITTSILANSEKEPIIIIQGDHGPGSYLDFDDYENNKCLFERFSILNAYYFPDQNYENLYPGITPVNSFRLILNQYFGLSYDLLDDRSFFSTNDDLLNFIEVTDTLNAQNCEPIGDDSE